MGNELSVSFDKRDFSGPAGLSGYTFQVERLNWRAVGGPWSGRVRVTAGAVSAVGTAALPGLWALTDLLRCPATVCDRGPAWWGYVSAVEVHAPAAPGGSEIVTRVELDAMWNRVMVEYFTYHPVDPAGARHLTSIGQWAESVANYGAKERVFTAPGFMVDAQAASYMQTMLNMYGQPVWAAENGTGTAGYYAVVELRGWWETLDWKFYSDSRGRIGQTTAGFQQLFGNTSANRRMAEDFVVGAEGWNCTSVWLKLKKIGYTFDNITVSLHADSAGAPGTVLATASYANPHWIGEAGDWYEFVLSAPVALAASTRYWITFYKAGTWSATGHYAALGTWSNLYAGGQAWYSDDGGSTWVSMTFDLGFIILGTADGASQIARIADSAAGAGQFFTGCRVEAVIGVESIPYRDGSTRGREEMEQHLRTGTLYGERLLAEVDAERRVRVYSQPHAEDARLMVDERGKITQRGGGPVDLGQQPAGQWVDLGWNAVGVSTPGYVGAVFVEACTWTPNEGLRLDSSLVSGNYPPTGGRARQ